MRVDVVVYLGHQLGGQCGVECEEEGHAYKVQRPVYYV